MTKKAVRIDIISDVVCPWCVIGYKRLEKSLETLSDTVDVDIHWHPFELNPTMQEGGENLRAHMAAKYGTTLEGSIKARANLTQAGAELGFTFNYFDEMKMFNTFKAHQLLHFAREQEKEHELKMRLFSAFFGERKAVDQIDVLAKEAAAVGLDEQQARQVLLDQQYADAVRKEQHQWQQIGVHAVPVFIFNERYPLQGAHDIQTFTSHITNVIASA